jgi:MFS family permease
VIGTGVAGVMLAVAFIWVERRVEETLLPLELFKIRIVTVSCLAGLVIGALLFAVTIYAPVFMQDVLGSSATNSGALLIPLSAGWVVSSVIVGQIVSNTGRYRIWPIIGSTLVLVSMILLTTLDTGSTLALVSAYLVIVGVGMGVMFQVYVIAAQNAVPVDKIGVTTGQLNFYRSMGGAFAVAGLGAILTSRLGTELVNQLGRVGGRIDPDRVVQSGSSRIPQRLEAGVQTALSNSLHTVFLVCVPIAAIGLALAFALEEKPLRRQSPEAVRQQQAAEPEAASTRARA